MVRRWLEKYVGESAPPQVAREAGQTEPSDNVRHVLVADGDIGLIGNRYFSVGDRSLQIVLVKEDRLGAQGFGHASNVAIMPYVRWLVVQRESVGRLIFAQIAGYFKLLFELSLQTARR